MLVSRRNLPTIIYSLKVSTFFFVVIQIFMVFIFIYELNKIFIKFIIIIYFTFKKNKYVYINFISYKIKNILDKVINLILIYLIITNHLIYQ